MGSGIFSLGTSALIANQALMDTTSHNIANVNTPGYSRQQVDLGTQDGLYTGAGFYGRGVKVQTITRTTNEFLIKEANLYTAQSSSDSSRLDKLNQLQNVLATGEAGLGYSANQFLNAFSDVVTQPQDTSARQVVLSRAQEFVNRLNTAGNQMVELQTGVVSDVGVSVTTINKLTAQIASVNDAVARYQGSGHTPNDLLDKRDELVRQLNEQVQVSTVNAEDGSLNVFMSGGQLLVLGSRSETLSAVRDPSNGALARVALNTNGSTRILDSGQIMGGALSGLLKFQDQDLVPLQAQVDSFASTVANAVNAQQQLGYNINAPTLAPPAIFANTQSAVTIKLALSNTTDLAAASPLTTAVPASNSGTVAVDALTMTNIYATSGEQATMPVQLKFTDVAGTMSYYFEDSAGNLSATQAWAGTGTPLNYLSPTNPTASPALFSVTLSGVPRTGDVIDITPTTFPKANNGNAMAMLNLRDANIASLDGGATLSTATNTYSQMIGNLGVMVQDGKTSASISATLQTNAESTLASTAGVNLDEEAARLIQFQQAYQASAKVLQIAQSLFDNLLQIARG
ncbi:MAG: flagellar hook-associated protein FlgK [Pseudomonadota bacterium]|jgi:flagellar hook-associated protein 1 FlgK